MRVLAMGLLIAWTAAGQISPAAGWQVLPLVVDGKIDAAWKQVDWGGFVVDQGALRTNPDSRGMGLLVYTRAPFGDCRIRVVYRSEKPSSNSGVFIRMDDGILSRLGEKTKGVEREKDGQALAADGREDEDFVADADRCLVSGPSRLRGADPGCGRLMASDGRDLFARRRCPGAGEARIGVADHDHHARR